MKKPKNYDGLIIPGIANPLLKRAMDLHAVDMADEMLINMLTAYGIPAVKLYPSNGGFGKVVLGISGEGADIFVPASMHEDAVSLLEGSTNE